MPSVPGSTEGLRGRIAVVGLGLMGGSLVRALAGRPGVELVGWSPEAEERARAAPLLASAPDALEDLWEGVDLVVLAAPLEATLALLPRAAEAAPEAVLTDVASLKTPLEQVVRAHRLSDRFVGSHPMAGSEAFGWSASHEELYHDAPVWLVEEAARQPARRMARALWEAVGARPRRIGAEAHDRLMARVSHLPQLAATALASTMAEAGVRTQALGPGGRDMTRLAGSSPRMWSDLWRHAPEDLPDLLRAYAAAVQELADLVEDREIQELTRRMEATRSWRSTGTEAS